MNFAKHFSIRSALSEPGIAIHELGTARMGDDPKKSVTDSHCQLHDVKNVFAMDGACFVSSGRQKSNADHDGDYGESVRSPDRAVQETRDLKREGRLWGAPKACPMPDRLCPAAVKAERMVDASALLRLWRIDDPEFPVFHHWGPPNFHHNQTRLVWPAS